VQALGKAEAGLHEEAVALISAEVSRGPDGRSRFRAKLQLADICMRVGYIAMAKAVLEELVRTVDEHRLETWESPGGVARVLSMFYRCLSASESDPARKEEVYSRLCRLDPRQAPPA
jgi:hypothetical protein